MNRVMERRNLLAGLFVLVVSMFVLAGTASAHSAHKSKKVAPAALEEEKEEAACKIIAEPGKVMDVGEFAHHSSIATIFEVECQARYSEKFVRIASNELWSKCDKKLKWIVASPFMHEPEGGENGGKEFKAELDDEGNATVAVIGGPSCAAEGGALVTVDLESGTHPTAVTEVEITVPRKTPEGVTVFPEVGAIESATDSSLLGVAQIEFPAGLAEEEVSITDRQLFEKCKLGSKIRWFGEGAEKIAEGLEAHAVLDNNGNAFVVFEAGESCKAGETLFEVSLEEPPFTTLETIFKVLPPQPTFP